MRTAAGTAGLVLACDVDGFVRAVVRDDIGFEGGAAAGRSFPGLVASSSVRKALDFLVAVRTAPVVGWELFAGTHHGERALYFAGSVEGAELLIVGAPTRTGLRELCDELAMDPGALGEAVRSIRSTASGHDGDEGRPLDELARLYSEFASLQRDLARKNVELARMVAQRDRLVSTAAHDLRSPLGAIHNYATLLREDLGDRLTKTESRALERIEHSSQFMEKLVEGMLELSRSNWGVLDLSIEEIDLGELLSLVVVINRPSASRKEIDISLVVDEELPRVAVDSHKIEQVLNNLIGNAIKYSQSGTEIRVIARREAETCLVCVQDQGQGIPEEELGQVFEPFVRTSVRPTGGESTTGLGLAIAKGIVEAHGGVLSVESKVGHGSAFRFTVPTAGSSGREPDAGAD